MHAKQRHPEQQRTGCVYVACALESVRIISALLLLQLTAKRYLCKEGEGTCMRQQTRWSQACHSFWVKGPTGKGRRRCIAKCNFIPFCFIGKPPLFFSARFIKDACPIQRQKPRRLSRWWNSGNADTASCTAPSSWNSG